MRRTRSQKKRSKFISIWNVKSVSSLLSSPRVSRIQAELLHFSITDAYARGEVLFKQYQEKLKLYTIRLKNFITKTYLRDSVSVRRLIFLLLALLYIYFSSYMVTLVHGLDLPIFSKLHVNTPLNLSIQNVFPFGSDVLGTATASSRPEVDQPLAETLPSPTQALSEGSPSAQMTIPTPQEASGFCLNVPVLLYHHVEPYNLAKLAGHAQLTVDSSIFEQQIKYLVENNYHLISAEELVNALLNKSVLPEKPVVVTLDDGYEDAYLYAFETAKKYNVIINIMVATGLVENPGYLSWNQIREMHGSGLVYHYDHTWSHFALTLGDEKKIEQEVVDAKKKLEEILGREQKIFTYPYGMFDKRSIEVLKRNGFLGAFTTIHAKTQCDSFIYTLHRDHVGNAPLSSYGL